MTQLQILRTQLEQKKGQKFQLERTLKTNKEDLLKLKTALVIHEQAREIIREVGMKTQQQLQFHISDITSLALNTVFDDPYQLKVEFVQRRNKTECDLIFVKGGMELDPIEASGVGAIDVASYALRIASWSMNHPKTRNVIIMDEPFRCLSKEFQERAPAMIKEISEKLNIQFIIITHEEVLADAADKIFQVKIVDRVSKVF